MLIVLSGLPGTGKTSIARALASQLSAVHVRIDSIEQALKNDIEPMNDAGYRVAYAIAEDNLRVGRTVIADAVNPVHLARDQWIATANQLQQRALEVEIICSDLTEHQRRVEARVADIAGHGLPTWADILAHEYHPWSREHLVIDTANLSLADAVSRILHEMQSKFA